MLAWIKQQIEAFMAWLIEALLWIPQKLWELILDGLAALIEAIPVPDWLSGAAGIEAAIPPSVGYLLHIMRVPEGLAIIFGALALRFLIRRIPLIG